MSGCVVSFNETDGDPQIACCVCSALIRAPI